MGRRCIRNKPFVLTWRIKWSGCTHILLFFQEMASEKLCSSVLVCLFFYIFHLFACLIILTTIVTTELAYYCHYWVSLDMGWNFSWATIIERFFYIFCPTVLVVYLLLYLFYLTVPLKWKFLSEAERLPFLVCSM